MMKTIYLTSPMIILFLFAVLSIHAQPETNFYVQGNNNRIAAEWEPASGTLVAWPLSVPYMLVENESTKKE
ncbi:MAG: hypothetical protein ABIT58_04415, partial [Ferruginibacter sp.]